jgi:hypothetical protein
MPLHDWTDQPGWVGMHLLWTTELLKWVRRRLPPGYRVFIGSAPVLAIGAPRGRADMRGQDWPEIPGVESVPSSFKASDSSSEDECEPDIEVAVATLDPNIAVWVEKQGRLIAAIELISPRNKDRPTSREIYLARYLGYLVESVHLLLIDVHRRPIGFSFADGIAQELSIDQAPLPTPLAVSYRVGEPAATGGSYLAIWRRALKVGSNLPRLPLPLSTDCAVWIDLERTYSSAAADVYLV